MCFCSQSSAFGTLEWLILGLVGMAKSVSLFPVFCNRTTTVSSVCGSLPHIVLVSWKKWHNVCWGQKFPFPNALMEQSLHSILSASFHTVNIWPPPPRDVVLFHFVPIVTEDTGLVITNDIPNRVEVVLGIIARITTFLAWLGHTLQIIIFYLSPYVTFVALRAHGHVETSHTVLKHKGLFLCHGLPECM